MADPLRALHRTMERVANGHLNATVPIADSGEIGDLQLRFNRMTAGLREREHLLRSGVSTVAGVGQMSPPGR